jgi:hypothetical protein
MQRTGCDHGFNAAGHVIHFGLIEILQCDFLDFDFLGLLHGTSPLRTDRIRLRRFAGTECQRNGGWNEENVSVFAEEMSIGRG